MPRRRRRNRLDEAAAALGELPRAVLNLPHRALALATGVPKRRIGAIPGSLPEEHREGWKPARIAATVYSRHHATEHEDLSATDLPDLQANGDVLWVDLVGVDDLDTVRSVAEVFDLHPLIVEDLVHPHQRPKMEAYPSDHGSKGQLFIVARMLHTPDSTTGELNVEQVGFVLGDGYLLTFQERSGDVFEPVRDRLRQNAGRIRRMGPDYLAYALLDVIVDHYFVVLESVAEGIDALEAAILEEPLQRHQEQIRVFRRSVLFLRRSIWPLREVVNGLLRDESGLIHEHTRVFLRDVYDHTIQVVEIMEGFRDMLSTLNDLYLSSLSHRLNEVMKVLTVVGTIFIPLSFFAGIYGMNFEHMPELGFRYGYFIFLGVAGLLLVGSLTFFRRRGWI